MKHFIIDGNNLIGKIDSLKRIHRKDKKLSRVNLAFILERYFQKKKVIAELFYDGFENEKIKVNGIKICYSDKLTADDMIRKRIEKSNNRKNIIVITSDRNLAEFARVCTCKVYKSEDFAKQIYLHPRTDEEEKRIEEIKDSVEFKKLFGID